MHSHRLSWAAPLLLAAFGAMCYWNLGVYDMLIWDEAEYASIGRSLARGDGYTISGDPQWIRPPVTPAIIGSAILLFGSSSDAIAKLPMPLVGAAVLALLYSTLLPIHGRLPAFIAAASLAIAPQFTTQAITLLSETPFLLFYTAALVSFFLAFRRSERWFHAAWAALALAFLTRYTALLFGPTLLLLLIYEAISNRANLRRIVTGRTFWLAPLWGAAITAPWFTWQWRIMGDPLACVKYASGQVPDYNLASMPWYFYLSSLPDAMSWPIAAAGAAGLAYAVWKNQPLGVYAAISATVLIGWHTQYDYKEMRFVASALPLFAIGVGIAAHAWVEPFEASRRFARTGVPAAVLLGSAAWALPVINGAFQTRMALGEPSFLDAMAHVRQRFAPGTRLLGENQAQIHWYSDRFTISSANDPAAFVSQLQAVDWLVITNFERGQPDHITRVGERITVADQLAGNVEIFRDPNFVTILAKSEWVLEQIAAEHR